MLIQNLGKPQPHPSLHSTTLLFCYNSIIEVKDMNVFFYESHDDSYYTGHLSLGSLTGFALLLSRIFS